MTGGLPYLVGENGPEIFVPNATGRIETNGVLNSLSKAGGRATVDKGLTVGVDASAIEQAGETAKKSGAIITASLDTTTKPIVDTSSIDAATAAAERLKAVLATVGASSISVGGGPAGGASGGNGSAESVAAAGRGAGSAASAAGGAARGAGGGSAARAASESVRAAGAGSATAASAAADAAGYTGNDGRRASRSGMTAAGRENVASWSDFFQRPVDKGGMGADREHAHGMIAMMQGESGLNLNPASAGDHKNGVPQSFGTVQWNVGAGRFAGLKATAEKMGKPWTDRGVQQAFFRHEMLEGGYRGAWNRIQAAKGGEGALAAGIDHYENPQKHALAYAIRKPFLDWLRRDGVTPPAVAEAGKPPGVAEAGKPTVAEASKAPAVAEAGKPPVALAGARERGGPVDRGLSYLVGERGPEIFTPGARGQISTNGALNTLAGFGRAAIDGDGPSMAPDAATVAKLRPDGARVSTRGDTHYAPTFHIHDAHNPAAVQRQVSDHFRDMLRELESDQRGSLSD